jgi:hypothetical protein
MRDRRRVHTRYTSTPALRAPPPRCHRRQRREPALWRPGADTLIGGHLGTHYLTAGTGRTAMEESNGNAVMYGGKGADTFKGENMGGVMVCGRGSSG